MSEQEIEQTLIEAIEDAAIEGFLRVRSFEDTGVMTNDRGFTVRTADGEHFQVSIVRSR